MSTDAQNSDRANLVSRKRKTLDCDSTMAKIASASVGHDDGSDATDKSFSVPGFLREFLMEEFGGDGGGSRHRKLMVIATHTIMLECGFLGFDEKSNAVVNGFRPPRDWPPSGDPFAMTLLYTLPERNNRLRGGESVKNVVLEFQSSGEFITVSGRLDIKPEKKDTNTVESEKKDTNMVESETESEKNDTDMVKSEKESEKKDTNMAESDKEWEMVESEKESEKKDTDLVESEKESEKKNTDLVESEKEWEMVESEKESEKKDTDLVESGKKSEKKDTNMVESETESEKKDTNTVESDKESEKKDTYSVRMKEDQLIPFTNIVIENKISGIDKRTSPGKEVFTFWRTIKDDLAVPLSMDLRYGSSNYFMRLSTKLKLKILESLSVADLANVGSVCHELKCLASSDKLWKSKYEDEFDDNKKDARVSWKMAYRMARYGLSNAELAFGVVTPYELQPYPYPFVVPPDTNAERDMILRAQAYDRGRRRSW
ncbi:hypothetical protein ACP275_02G046300 [Erythranthe tilingii]